MEIKGILFDMDGTLINTYENFDYKQAFHDMSDNTERACEKDTTS